MANSQIVIKISSTNSGSGVQANQNITTASQPVANEGAKKPEKAGESDAWKGLTKTLVIDNGRRILTDSINKYLDLTGNSSLSNKVNLVSTLSGYATAIATGGIVGAVAVAMDVGTKALTSAIEVRKANADIELLRQRTGNSTLNGGRGSYD